MPDVTDDTMQASTGAERGGIPAGEAGISGASPLDSGREESMGSMIGRKVRLKSGGPVMTIIDVGMVHLGLLGSSPTGNVRCAWIANDIIGCADFDARMLEDAQ